MAEYKKRIADQILADKLEAMGAVLIEGAKYCGKTTLACQHAQSILYMADPDTKSQNLAMAQTNIKKLLQGDTPRLIDEWQLAPQFWDAVRNEVDKRGEDGQFLLTGSAVPPKQDEIFPSGTGRISWLKLRTMSLWESGDSSGEVSLGALFRNPDDVDGRSNIDIDKLAFLTCRGGWPKATLKTNKKAALQSSTSFSVSLRWTCSLSPCSAAKPAAQTMASSQTEYMAWTDITNWDFSGHLSDSS